MLGAIQAESEAPVNVGNGLCVCAHWPAKQWHLGSKQTGLARTMEMCGDGGQQTLFVEAGRVKRLADRYYTAHLAAPYQAKAAWTACRPSDTCNIALQMWCMRDDLQRAGYEDITSTLYQQHMEPGLATMLSLRLSLLASVSCASFFYLQLDYSISLNSLQRLRCALAWLFAWWQKAEWRSTHLGLDVNLYITICQHTAD